MNKQSDYQLPECKLSALSTASGAEIGQIKNVALNIPA